MGCTTSKPKVKDEDREPYGTTSDGERPTPKAKKSSKKNRSSASATGNDSFSREVPTAGHASASHKASTSGDQLPKAAVIANDKPDVDIKSEELKQTAAAAPTAASVETNQLPVQSQKEKPLHQTETVAATVTPDVPAVAVAAAPVAVAAEVGNVSQKPTVSSGGADTSPSKTTVVVSSSSTVSATGPIWIQPNKDSAGVKSIPGGEPSAMKSPLLEADSGKPASQPVELSQVRVSVQPQQQQRQSQQPNSTDVKITPTAFSPLKSTVPVDTSGGELPVSPKKVNGEISVSKSPPSPATIEAGKAEVVAGDASPNAAVADVKRAAFAQSSHVAVDPAAQQRKSPERAAVVPDVPAVNIKPVDPSMKIFDALHTVGIKPAGDVDGKSEPTKVENKQAAANGADANNRQISTDKPGVELNAKLDGPSAVCLSSTPAKIPVGAATTNGAVPSLDAKEKLAINDASVGQGRPADQGHVPAVDGSPLVKNSSLPRPNFSASVDAGVKENGSARGNDKENGDAKSETSLISTPTAGTADKSSATTPSPAVSGTSRPLSDRTTRLPTVSRLPTVTGQTPTVTSPTSDALPTITSAVTPAKIPTSPAATSIASEPKLSEEQPAQRVDRLKDLLVDATAANKSVTSRHQMAANTRSRLLQTIEQWFSGSANQQDKTESSPSVNQPQTPSMTSPSRVMVVHGRQGVGKTCLAADLCRRYAARRQLLGCHFFHRLANDTRHNRPSSMLLSLARRLIDLQQVGDQYLRSLPPPEVLEKSIDQNDTSSLYEMLIVQPFKAMTSSPATIQRQLIVVDAVDECSLEDRDLLLRLVDQFDTTTPNWLFLAVTMREDNQLVSRFEHAKTIELRCDVTDTECLADVKRFLRDSMSPYIDRISLDGALAQLAKNAEANFLCAKLLKSRLDALPDGTKLALRDISLTFPTGLGEICRQTFQALFDRLTAATDKNRNKNRPTAYATVAAVLVTAVEPLHKSAFGLENVDAVVQAASSGVLTLSDDGMVSLCHSAIVEWLLSEQTPTSLRVDITNARQLMSEAVMHWISSVVEDPDSAADGGNANCEVHRSVVDYAAKHVVYHLTDATKQQENIARVLCSLRFIEYKLRMPDVTLADLMGDYKHLHVQVTSGGTSAAGSKLITIDAVMKRNPELIEQISLLRSFIVRYGPCIERIGAQFTLHVAANYPTVPRIQENARLDLGDGPWVEDLTAVADTKSISRSLSGTIVDADLSTDQHLVAIVTAGYSGSVIGSRLLYLFNTATMEPVNSEPVDLQTLLSTDATATKSKLCVRFIPAGTTPSVFVGSLSKFVAVRGGKFIDSGLDVSSVKMAEQYSIECAAVGGSLLACAGNSLPFGGRSLFIILFDVQTKKCNRTIEVLKFRFGGNPQYGIKACALSADGATLCACVKQSVKVELKVTIWSTGKGDVIASIDVENDSLSKCSIFTGEQPAVVVTSGFREAKDRSSSDGVGSKTFVWNYLTKTSKPVALDDGAERSIGHAVGQQVVHARWRANSGGSTLVLRAWKKGQSAFCSSTPPDRKFAVYSPDDAVDLMLLEKSVLLLTKSAAHLCTYQNSHVIDSTSSGFISVDSFVEGLGFVPRSDDPVIAYRPFCSEKNETESMSACAILIKPEGLSSSITNKLFELSAASESTGSSCATDHVFPRPEVCAYSADGSCAIIHFGFDVHVLDIEARTQRRLPRPAGADSGKCRVRHCVVAPKESIVGLVYVGFDDVINLYDAKTPESGRPLHQLRLPDVAPVTDFFILPYNSHVVAYFRSLNGGTLAVWNQRTGSLVNSSPDLDISYVRSSPATDRIILSQSATIVLRSHDNRYNKSLDSPSSWNGHPTDMEFSADGTVVLGIGRGEFRVWNAGNGDVLRSFSRLGQPVTSSPSANTIAESEILSRRLEVVGMVNGALVLLHSPDNENLLVVDVTSGIGSDNETSAAVVAAVPTNGLLDRKSSSRRLRMSPRSGVHVVGATTDGQLRLFALRNMTSSKRQTTLQMIKSTSQQQQPTSASNK